MRTRLLRFARHRETDGLSVADIHLGLHAGRVYYGNIGTPDRLDFTVVGQPVNEVSRISSMCEWVGRSMLCSWEFAELLLGEEREKLVSIGRFALRGVGRAQELFTLDPSVSLEGLQPSPGPRRRQAANTATFIHIDLAPKSRQFRQLPDPTPHSALRCRAGETVGPTSLPPFL